MTSEQSPTSQELWSRKLSSCDFSLHNSRTRVNWNLLGINLSKPTNSNYYLISNNRYSTSNNEYITQLFDIYLNCKISGLSHIQSANNQVLPLNYRTLLPFLCIVLWLESLRSIQTKYLILCYILELLPGEAVLTQCSISEPRSCLHSSSTTSLFHSFCLTLTYSRLFLSPPKINVYRKEFHHLDIYAGMF